MLEINLTKNTNDAIQGTLGKYYGRVEYKGTLGVKDLAKIMKKHTTAFSLGEITGMLLDLASLIKEYALMGYVVKIDDLGLFKASIDANGLTLEQGSRVSAGRGAQKTDEHQLNIEYKYVETPAGGKTELTLKLPLTLERKELDFFQQDNDATVHRHRYRPEVFVEFLKNRYFPKGSFLLYSLQYTLKSDMPTLTNLVRFKNDMNPLVIFEGNPGLKDSYAHGFFGQLLWQSNKAYVQRMNLSYDIYTNMLANAQVYDRTTGVRHLTPMNVNGNWLLRLNVANSLYVSGNRLSSIGNEVTFLWQNSADYSSGSASTLSDKRIVRNFSVMERMNFSWMSRNTRVRNEGFLYVNHSRATCREEGFERISTTDYGLQDQVTAELPWNLRLTSSILAVFRAGYSAADMNDEEFIWNANLAKSFGERYSVSLELYDMLNQRKNIYHYVNAQGNTDVFYNNMRRYAMLHFTMRLSKTKQPR